MNDSPELHYDENQAKYQCLGVWSTTTLNDFLAHFKNKVLPSADKMDFDGEKLRYLDSAGALCLHNCFEFLKKNGKSIQLKGFSPEHLSLLELIQTNQDKIVLDLRPTKTPPLLYRIGKETVYKAKQAEGFISLVGDLSTKLFGAFGQWKRFQLSSIVSVIYTAGIQSLPILALLSFLIGVVIAYQLGIQLQTYGANIFIAYISGEAIFREFGPLITAIIIAGRTSSSFTAQIGSMKINEEIDAINTMGLSSTELIIMPKVLGLLFVFPLLIFWSDVFSLIGAMALSQWALGIQYFDFLSRVKDTVQLQPMLLGLYKAPAYALVIALVGCFQGFSVNSSATSIGSQTTRAVVQALFLIIVTDAIYSIIYSWLNL